MLPSKLFHYSPRIVTELKHEFYEKFKLHWPEEGSMKPCGLWFSVEDYEEDETWYKWCVGEGFRLESLKYRYKVNVAPDAKILWLRSCQEIAAFSNLYAANESNGFDDWCKKHNTYRYHRGEPYIYMISWLTVKKVYDGMIIAPYQWDMRMSGIASWYYPWDCASGCIWNLDKVNLTLDSEVDVETLIKERAIRNMEVLGELEGEESEKDSQSASPVLSQ